MIEIDSIEINLGRKTHLREPKEVGLDHGIGLEDHDLGIGKETELIDLETRTE